MTVDLLLESINERVVGALVHFEASQGAGAVTAVGQIVSIELHNRWHQDSVFRNLIKRTGEIPPITGLQDTRVARLAVGATFQAEDSGGYVPITLGMVPSTGTAIERVDQPQLDRLLSSFSDELFYLGRAYANDVFYPKWFKHFGSGPRGSGEAYHLGVFGKTGSGKSGLAKMLLAAYARHPELGILVIDPQGEFSHELAGQRIGRQGLPLDGIIAGYGRPIQRYTIADLQLEGWDLFEDFLVQMHFCEKVLGIPMQSVDNGRLAAEYITDALKKKDAFKLAELGSDDALRFVLNAARDRAGRIYASQPRAERLQDRIDEILAGEFAHVLAETWKPICALFAAGGRRRKIYGIVRDLVESDAEGGPRPLVVIDISERSNDSKFWSEELERRILARLLGVLIDNASKGLAKNEGANTLVVLDEAHRHAPSGPLDGDSQAAQLRSVLRRAVRETRKYGVGWFFISQTLGGIDNEILHQLRSLFFGFGLALGDEYRKLREFTGGDEPAMDLYRSFRDPASAPRDDLREFPFMAVGPVSPLSYSGRPLFFSAFIDPQEFCRVNGLEVRESAPQPPNGSPTLTLLPDLS
ncbi:MAG TPA: DUF87 domain-containing protein [Solirubrobacteraceae bacterium]